MSDQPISDRRRAVATSLPERPGDTVSAPGLWDRILSRLQTDHPEKVRGWFARLRPVGLERGILTLATENDAQRSYLDSRCRAELADVAQRIAGRLISFSFVATEADRPGALNDGSTPPLGCGVYPLMTFDAFAEGPCNRLAFAAAQAFAADRVDAGLGLLYLHGGPGTGKTHLLHAIANAVASTTSFGCRYVTAEAFCVEWIKAIESGRESAFRRTFRETGCLLVDGVDALADRQRSQEEFFHTLNAALNSQMRFAVAASLPPGELAGFAPRIRDRLSAAFCVAIDPPCRETRAAILRSLARSRSIEIADSAAALLVGSRESSARELADALVWLDSQSRFSGGRITEDGVRDWLATLPAPAAVNHHPAPTLGNLRP